MSDPFAVLHRPGNLAKNRGFDRWFTDIASFLLNRCWLIVNHFPHRIAEIEFYWWSDHHPDPFAHRSPLQRERGRWYFHRTGGTYRNGTFKGLDLTFGDGTAFGGILIRSIVVLAPDADAPGSLLIDGPSLCVDHLLKAAGKGTVADLDRHIGCRVVDDPSNPLCLLAVPSQDRPIYRSARIGLSLRRFAGPGGETDEALDFLGRPYRFLTEPRRIAQGKPLLVLELQRRGLDREEIRRLTGCTRTAIDRYCALYREGMGEKDLGRWLRKESSAAERCRLQGAWSARSSLAAKAWQPAPHGLQ